MTTSSYAENIRIFGEIPAGCLSLGDLGTGRNKIGRLKLHFEEGVNEEWFLWTNIQKGLGYPIGSGTAINASAAKHI